MGDDAKSNLRVLAAGVERAVPNAPGERRAADKGSWLVRKIAPLVAGLALVASPANVGCSDDSQGVEDVQDADAQDVEEDGSAPDSDVEEADAVEEDGGAESVEEDAGTDVEDVIDMTDELVEEADADAVGDTADSESEEDGCTPVGPHEQLVDNPQPDVRDYLGGSTQVQVLHYDVTENCDGTVDRELREIEYVFTPPLGDMELAIRRGIDTSHVEVDNPIYRVIAYDGARGCITYSIIIDSATLDSRHPEEYVDDGTYNAVLRGGQIYDDGGVLRRRAVLEIRIEMDTLRMVGLPEGQLDSLPDGNRLMPTAVYIYGVPDASARVAIVRPEIENIEVCEGDRVTAPDGTVFEYHATPTGWTYRVE